MSTLYIFGSGASKCAGLPIVKDTIECVMNEIKASTILECQEGKEIQLQKIKAVEEIINEFRIETHKENIEDLLIWLSEKRKWNSKSMFLPPFIYWYFWDKVHNLNIFRFHKLFVEKILNSKEASKEIICFNYDLILESALGWKPNYKHPEIPKEFKYNKDSTTVTIYKPMGSINWLQDRLGENREKLHFEDFFLGEEFLLDKEEKIWMVNGYNQDVLDGGSFLRIVMKWFETIPKECKFFDEIFSNSAQLLNEIDKVVVLGYSFPTDAFKGSLKDKEILDNIFSMVKRTKDIIVELVCGNIPIKAEDKKLDFNDSYEEIEDRIQCLFGEKTNVKFLIPEKRTFEEWVLANVPEEKAAN